jgi:hypothetical protein
MQDMINGQEVFFLDPHDIYCGGQLPCSPLSPSAGMRQVNQSK